MRIEQFAPRAELAAFVRGFTLLETTTDSMVRTLLPDDAIVLGIRYAGHARQLEHDPARKLPNATLAGLRASARRMYTSERAGVVLATFHTTGAARFFATPLHELFGETAPLDALVPASAIERVRQRVCEARDARGRVAAVEEFLLERLGSSARDALVSTAVTAIERARGNLRIGELARSLSLSRDRLEKRFRSAVGATPKQLATILRVKTAVELHRSGVTLTDAALEAGYFDQSHFIREFKLFTGLSPRRFFDGVEHC